MALVETVMNIAADKVEEVAKTIEGELKDACPRRSGKARASIHIEQVDFTTFRIGATATFPPDGEDGGTHLYYADQGNAGSGAIIYPKREVNRRGVPPAYLKFKDGTYHLSARAYSGTHFIEDVANRHR